MPPRKKKALGRGMAELVEGSFSSIVDPSARGPKKPAAPVAPAAPASRPEPESFAPVAPPPVQAAPRPEPPSPPAAAPARAEEVPEPSSAPSQPAARGYEVISVASGKGGTGKSVLTSNLGVLLAGSSRVTLLDADLGLANIHILYNLMPRYNVSHLISGEKTLDEILIEGPGGVAVIPGGSGIPELATLSDMMFGSLVSGMTSLDAATDLLLVDTPSGIDRQSLLFLLASDQVLVVTTQDITAMTDAYAVIKTVVTRRPSAAVALVVNQAASYPEGLETFQKVAHVARKFLARELALGGVVPFDELVERSVAERVPVVLSHPASPAARAMASIAGRLGAIRHPSVPPAKPFPVRLRGLLSSRPGRGA